MRKHSLPSCRPIKLTLALLVLLATAGIAPAQVDLAALNARADKIFAAYDKPDSPGCALAVINNGAVIHKRGFGRANLETDAPNAPNTIFHIASVSKQFTTFAILLLAKEGKLSLDDDIRKHLPDMADFGKTITIRHLIHHTSGLRDQWRLLKMAGWRMEDVITERDILDLVFRQKDLNFAPGAEHLYSNTGYTLMAVIVQRISNQSFREFTQERIFKPLEMTSTHFHDDHRMIVKNRAYSYRPLRMGGFELVPLQYANVGATSLFTTVEDLAKWDRNFYDANLGGREAIEEMHRKGKLNSGKELDYAGGLMLREYRGLQTVEHGGADAGYRSVLLRFPEQKFSVVLLANIDNFNPTGMARQVADIYLQDQLKPLPAAPPDRGFKVLRDEDLQSCVGDYRTPLGTLLTISKEDDQLYSQQTGQPKVKLFSRTTNEFVGAVLGLRIVFADAEEGKRPRATLNLAGNDLPSPRVQRVTPTKEQLAAYAGDFYSEELGVVYRVNVKDGRLTVREPRGTETLMPTTADEFLAPLGTLTFARDKENRITGFGISAGRVRDLRFVRVDLKAKP